MVKPEHVLHQVKSPTIFCHAESFLYINILDNMTVSTKVTINSIFLLFDIKPVHELHQVISPIIFCHAKF